MKSLNKANSAQHIVGAGEMLAVLVIVTDLTLYRAQRALLDCAHLISYNNCPLLRRQKPHTAHPFLFSACQILPYSFSSSILLSLLSFLSCSLSSFTVFMKGTSFPPLKKIQSWPNYNVLSGNQAPGSVSTGRSLSTGHGLLAHGLDVHLCLWGWVNFQREEPRCLGPRGRGRWAGPGRSWGRQRLCCLLAAAHLGTWNMPAARVEWMWGFGYMMGHSFTSNFPLACRVFSRNLGLSQLL